MSIIRLATGELLFFNAVPVDGHSLAEILAWGRPSALVVPHHNHLLDAHAFVAKLSVKLFGPEQCRSKIAARVDFAGPLEAAPRDDSVDIEGLPGTTLGEPVIRIKERQPRLSSNWRCNSEHGEG